MKLGFIGAGNMGSAIINGILNQHALEPDSLYVSRKHPEKSTELAQKGVHIMQDNVSLAESVDCILLAVKPVTQRVSFVKFTTCWSVNSSSPLSPDGRLTCSKTRFRKRRDSSVSCPTHRLP